MDSEEIVFPTNPEIEMKLCKKAEETGQTRSEVIASAISSFLSALGF